jgi:hypothetical protein
LLKRRKIFPGINRVIRPFAPEPGAVIRRFFRKMLFTTGIITFNSICQNQNRELAATPTQMLIGNYLKYLFAIPHDLDFRFFWNFRKYRGTLALIGDDGGRTLTTVRIYNQSFRIVLFEQNHFFEKRIRAHRGITGANFEYYKFGIGPVQEVRTLFISKKGILVHRLEGSFENDPLKKHSAKMRGVQELAVEARTLDSLKRHWDAIRVSPEAFVPEMLGGMAATMERWKPLLMLPNISPRINQAAATLERRYYRPYLYNSRTNALLPVKIPARGRNLFFIHRAIMDPEKAKPIKVKELRKELKLSPV